MKEWIKIGAGLVGPIAGATKFLIGFVQEKHPMSFEQWGFWVFVFCSSVYGVYVLAEYFVKLNRRIRVLESQPKQEGATEELYETSDGRKWSAKRISELPEFERAQVRKEYPGLWDWYLGKPEVHRPLTTDDINNSSRDFPVP